MSETLKPQRTRIYAYDIIRIFAILCVVMIHVSAPLIKSDVESVDFLLGNILDGSTHLAVPLFIMLSGALMLNEKKQVSFEKIFRSSGFMLVILLIWSLIYAVIFYVALPIARGQEFFSKDFINAFVYGHYHLWYLFMIIGIYLITPVLRSFVKRENEKIVLYYLILSVAIKFAVPIINFFLKEYVVEKSWLTSYVNKFDFGFISAALTYYVLGWYVTNFELKKKHRIYIYALGVLSLLVTVLGTQFYSENGNKVNDVFYSNSSINMLLYSLAVFVFIYYFFKDKKFNKSAKFLTLFSNLTFGVYLVHVAVLYFVRKIIGEVGASIFQVAAEFFLTVLISFAFSFVISKIPVLKKIIKG